jgi:hypothetical protein
VGYSGGSPVQVKLPKGAEKRLEVSGSAYSPEVSKILFVIIFTELPLTPSC